MSDLFLLGDSVIDNSVYLSAGEPDTHRQIAALLPEHAVTMRAVDGFVAADVIKQLGDDPLTGSGAVFLSAGGNDALGSIGLLGDSTKRSFAEAVTLLYSVREGFRAKYAALLDRLGDRRVLAATIYAPNFSGPEEALQQAAEGALSAFNDVIQQEAQARGFDTLELRSLFTGPSDYANPIEPSAAGSGKIAHAVAGWFGETS